MEEELKQYLDDKGYLSTLARNKYLESKGACRLNELGHVVAILYEGDYLNMTFKYTQLNLEINEALKNIRHKSIGKAKVDFVKEVKNIVEDVGEKKEFIIDKQLLENAEYDHNKRTEELSAEDIPF